MVHDEDQLRTNADRLRPVRGVVLDVDGTLLDPAHRITSATRAAVARARDAGWHVLLASGRSPQGMTGYLAELGLDGPAVACNGALTFRLSDGAIRPLATRPLDRDVAAAAYALRTSPRSAMRRTTSGCCARPASPSRWATRRRRCSTRPRTGRPRTTATGWRAPSMPSSPRARFRPHPPDRKDRMTQARRRRRAPQFPQRIFALASPRSPGGVSLFDPGILPGADTVAGYASDEELVARAVDLLAGAGFDVLQATPLMINFAGPKRRFESAFATSLVAEERPVIKQGGVEGEATFLDTSDTPVRGLIHTAGTRFEAVPLGVALEEPTFPTASAFPPPADYFHLDVPAGVSLGCNADRAHRGGATGTGVTVAMVDTGWQTHPWFSQRGYRVEPVVLGPGTSDPEADENGHGSGESANIFSTAPDWTLLPVKAATAAGALVNMTAAFNAAVALRPDVISNSWSADIRSGPLSAADQARAAAVAAAWAAGIVVVFAAGNGHWGFPGQHPDVISVGGVSIAQDGALRASDYASGFESEIYPGP